MSNHDIIVYKKNGNTHRFFRGDFIHRIMDTMKYSDEEADKHQYLKEIKYSPNFNFGNDIFNINKK